MDSLLYLTSMKVQYTHVGGESDLRYSPPQPIHRNPKPLNWITIYLVLCRYFVGVQGPGALQGDMDETYC